MYVCMESISVTLILRAVCALTIKVVCSFYYCFLSFYSVLISFDWIIYFDHNSGCEHDRNVVCWDYRMCPDYRGVLIISECPD